MSKFQIFNRILDDDSKCIDGDILMMFQMKHDLSSRYDILFALIEHQVSACTFPICIKDAKLPEKFIQC